MISKIFGWGSSKDSDNNASSKSVDDPTVAGDKIETLSLQDPTVAGDLVILDNNGNVVLTGYERDPLPKQGTDDTKNEAALNCAKQIAPELLTKSLTLPGKTVEIAFDPAIQKGLNTGTYEIVKVASGEGKRLMARAIDSKQLVGQGRFMEIGKLRQIGVGAFHIVSIAVAQAHLMEINKNLEAIKEGLQAIRDFLEIKDIAKLEGTIKYLEHIVDFIRQMATPDSLPSEKRNELEAIRREMMAWNSQIKQEAEGLREKIEKQKDEDFFGTGDTFEKLKEHAAAVEKVIKKFRLLLRQANLFNLISAYLDPMTFRDKDAIRIFQFDPAEHALFLTLQILRWQSNCLLRGAIWNRDETLREREEEMEVKVHVLEYRTRGAKKSFTSGMSQLENYLKGIRDPQGKVRMAIAFDGAGNPEHVQLLSESEAL